MDYADYVLWLRQKCDQKLTNRYMRAAQEYEVFLRENRGGRSIEDATQEDFLAYEQSFSKESKDNRCPYWFLYRLYKYLENEDLAEAILKLMGTNPIPIELSTFRDINLAYRKKLSEVGIVSNMDILARARTPEDRRLLAEETGIPLDDLLEIVKLSDMRRMLGMSRIKSLNSIGIDTLEKLSQSDPQEILQSLRAISDNPEKVKDVDYRFIPYKATCYPVILEEL